MLALQGMVNNSIAQINQIETELVQLRPKNKAGIYEPVEEFNVLKSNKDVRHGSYVKYWPVTTSLPRVLETGNYDYGLKEGEWRCFSQSRPWNKLLSKGQYHAGLATDLWIYYWPVSGNSNFPEKITANPQLGKTGLTITLDDTAAIVQAKGVYSLGKRTGMWTFFDRNSVVIQKYNYSTGKLLFYRVETGEQPTFTSLSLNHPLLYGGGKAKLVNDIAESINSIALMNLGKVGEAEYVFSIDSTGTQVAVGLAASTPPTKYDKFMLDALSRIPGTWLPSVINARRVAATYRIKLVSEAKNDSQYHSTGVITNIKALDN
ncbi:MAG: toxin-antitoxin system YwqK family antitoxin [Janthinobacterium lividum]